MQNNDAVILQMMDNLRRVFHILHEESQRVKRETGLTGPQIWTIKVVHNHGPINISDIAKRMFLHPTTILGIIDRLEARGLVSRTRSKDDRRVIWVELTPSGRNLVDSVPEIGHGVMWQKFVSTPLDDLAAINNGLEVLVKICGVQGMPPKPILSTEKPENP